jgi:hypothetical protein
MKKIITTAFLVSAFYIQPASAYEICVETNPLIEMHRIINEAIAHDDPIIFHFESGLAHKGGIARAKAVPSYSPGLVKIHIDYQAYRKLMVPVPAHLLNGETTLFIPKEFTTEQGYKNLEKNKKQNLPDATLQHMGRVRVGKYTNVHHIKITAKDGKSITDLYYHPSAPGMGWLKMKLLVELPVLGFYEVKGNVAVN